MSLLVTAKSATALSQVEIDADKDWNANCISNLAAVLEGMAQGDMVYCNGASLARLPAGSPGHNLQCQGPGRNPKWA